MLVPVAIVLGCFAGGVLACARWLPDLADGPVGGLAFFVVCGLLAAALSLAGVHVYMMVREIDHKYAGLTNGEVFAADVGRLLFECGTLVGFASILYVLAPKKVERTPTSPLPIETAR